MGTVMMDHLSENNLRWKTLERACDSPELNFAKIRSPLWLERERKLELARVEKVLARLKGAELFGLIR